MRFDSIDRVVDLSKSMQYRPHNNHVLAGGVTSPTELKNSKCILAGVDQDSKSLGNPN